MMLVCIRILNTETIEVYDRLHYGKPKTGTALRLTAFFKAHKDLLRIQRNRTAGVTDR